MNELEAGDGTTKRPKSRRQREKGEANDSEWQRIAGEVEVSE